MRLPGDEALYLVTYLDYDSAAGPWTGPFVVEADQSLAISRDGRGPLPDRSFRRTDLPPPARCADASLLPNPIFGATVRECADRSECLPADRWDSLDAGVTSLEDTLFA